MNFIQQIPAVKCRYAHDLLKFILYVENICHDIVIVSLTFVCEILHSNAIQYAFDCKGKSPDTKRFCDKDVSPSYCKLDVKREIS